MDEWTLNDLLECSVCLDRLDTSSKVLPCQHTFCKKCLEEIVESRKELRCPECRVLVDISIEELPPNVLLMRILEGMKNAPKKSHQRGHNNIAQHLAATKQPQHSPAHANQRASSNHEHHHKQTTILPGTPCARALFSYASPEPGDLTFKKGDLILLKKKVDDNWFLGELSGQRGVFPSVYVEILTPLPSSLPQCKALYDFRMTTDEEEGCLTFTKGEVITVIRRVDENWAEGKLSDKIGIFPLAFVELNQVARALMKLSTNVQPGPSRVAPPTPTSEETIPLIPSTEATTQQVQQQQQQAGSGVAPHILHRLGGSSSSHSPSSSTTPNSSSTSGSSQSSTAPSSPASPPPVPENPPPTPHPRGNASNAQQHNREKRHSLNLLHANPPNIQRLSGEIPSHMDLAAAEPTQPVQGRNHRHHRRTVSDQPSSTADQLPALYVAMYPYKPQKVDELELKKGSLYLVSEKCQDGWFKGTLQGTHKSGVFPGNYVTFAKAQASSNAVTPKGRTNGTAVPSGTNNPAASMPWSRSNGSNHTPQQLQQQNRQSKSPNSGQNSERVYMDFARNMISAVNAVVTGSPSSNKHTPTASAAGLLSTPPELPPRAPSPNVASSGISASWHAPPSQSLDAAIGRSQSISMVGASPNNIITPPPNMVATQHSPRPVPLDNKYKEKKSSTGSGLIKRLTTIKKSKSPPPIATFSMDNPVFEDGCTSTSGSILVPQHARSGSCPSQLIDHNRLQQHLLFSSQRVKHKERPNIITANPAAMLVSGPRPVPLGASSIAVADNISHRKSNSLDADSKKQKPIFPTAKERFRCIVPYPPNSEYELALQVGDVIYVHKKRDDGWYKGTQERTGRTGLFPASFVEAL